MEGKFIVINYATKFKILINDGILSWSIIINLFLFEIQREDLYKKWNFFVEPEK